MEAGGLNYLVSLTPLVGIVISYVVIRGMLGSGRVKLPVDIPNSRSMHQNETPRGGGVAIVSGALAVLVVVGITGPLTPPLVIAAATLLLFGLVGWLDDLYHLSIRLRLLIQITYCAGLILFFGSPESLPMGGFHFQPEIWWYLISIPAAIWLINLYNFMDGIDGIAGLQTFIAALAYAGIFFLVGESSFALLWLGLASATLVFLWFNWSPPSLFMGDAGSLAIGALFAMGIVVGVTRHGLSLSVLLLPLGLFIVDATTTLIRRVGGGKSPFKAHRDHLYQRAARTWGHPATALGSGAIAIWLALLSLVELVGYYPSRWVSPLVGLFSLLVIGGAIFIRTRLRRE